MSSYGDFHRGNNAGKKDQSGFPSIINGDVHTEPGALTCSRAFEILETLNVKPNITAKLPNGDTFWASSTDGRIWKESDGTVTLVHTDSNGKHFGMEFSKGYLYYASETKLGRILIANASSEATWSSHNNNWQTFQNKNDKVFTMAEVRGKLLIPNKQQLAMVTYLGAFNANALDFYPDYTITCVQCDEITAVIGADDGTKTAIFTWDTLRSTWLIEDYIPEVGANMFIKLDNDIAIQVGAIGNIYKWSGRKAYLWKRLKNNGAISTSLNPYGSSNLNSLALITTGIGIFSIGRGDTQFPEAIVVEYTATNNGECFGIQTRGNDVIVGADNGDDFSIDKTGTGYATAVITTSEAKGKELAIYYDELPGDSSITARVKVDGGSKDENDAWVEWAEHPLKNSSDDDMRMRSKYTMSPKRRVQAEISLIPVGDNVPVIDSIKIK